MRHDPDRDFNTLHAAGNRNPRGIWSDGETMFVVDSSDFRVYAYKMSDMSRDESKEFGLEEHLGPRGIWGNTTTIWVSNDTDSTNSILAYSRVDDPGTPDDDEYGDPRLIKGLHDAARRRKPEPSGHLVRRRDDVGRRRR